MAESCPICLENFTPKTRQKVKCPFCPVAACKGCQQQALLNTYEDPHCFSCKAGWSADFLASVFPLSFRNGTLRRHRRRILFEREKALLPAMQIYVEAKKNMDRLMAVRTETYAKWDEVYQQLRKIRNNLHSAQLEYHRFREIKSQHSRGVPGVVMTEADKKRYAEVKKTIQTLQDEEVRFHQNEYTTAIRAKSAADNDYMNWSYTYQHGVNRGQRGEAEKERRQFLMRCPAEGCRGFLSQAYKCGVCEKKTCSDCLELLPAEDAAPEHTCKAENIETAKAIKKETRPCPKCGARIFKIDGCNQMYCTMEGCHTAFDWESGYVVTGRIHNPHYYEWLRRNGGNAAPPREAGDIPCGGLPAAWTFTRTLIRSELLSAPMKNNLIEIHRMIGDLEFRLRDYPARRDALANKDVNVKYLMNEIDEAEWQRQLELAEARFNRKKEIGQILQTLVTAAAEILQSILARAETSLEGGNPYELRVEAINWVCDTGVTMLEALRTYTNEAYRGLGISQHMAVPQIDDKWHWCGARALYKRPKNEIVEAGATAHEEPEPEPLLPPEAALDA